MDTAQIGVGTLAEAADLSPPASAPIGQLLLARGFISETDLERALAFQARFGGRLGAVLVRIGALSESNLLATLADQLGLPVLSGGDKRWRCRPASDKVATGRGGGSLRQNGLSASRTAGGMGDACGLCRRINDLPQAAPPVRNPVDPRVRLKCLI